MNSSIVLSKQSHFKMQQRIPLHSRHQPAKDNDYCEAQSRSNHHGGALISKPRSLASPEHVAIKLGVSKTDILSSYLLEKQVDAMPMEDRSEHRRLRMSKTRSLSREQREETYFDAHLAP